MLAPFCTETQGQGRTTGHCGPSRSARTRRPRQPSPVSVALGRHGPDREGARLGGRGPAELGPGTAARAQQCLGLPYRMHFCSETAGRPGTRPLRLLQTGGPAGGGCGGLRLGSSSQALPRPPARHGLERQRLGPHSWRGLGPPGWRCRGVCPGRAPGPGRCQAAGRGGHTVSSQPCPSLCGTPAPGQLGRAAVTGQVPSGRLLPGGGERSQGRVQARPEALRAAPAPVPVSMAPCRAVRRC